MTIIVLDLPQPSQEVYYEPVIADWFKLNSIAKAAEQFILNYSRFHYCSSLTSRLQIAERLLGE